MIDYKKYGDRLMVGVSGGKDSTATCLYLLEQGLTKDDFDRCFWDTGWESPQTYDYLNELEDTIGTIQRHRADIGIDKLPDHIKAFILKEEAELGYVSPFIRLVFVMGIFPSHVRKYCTSYLKMRVATKKLKESDDQYISVSGIRAKESKARSQMKEWSFNDRMDAWEWRPIINWSVSDVVDIHKRFGLAPNAAYIRGASRVGCYPCIYARKKQISLLSSERRSLIDRMERKIAEYALERFGDDERYKKGAARAIREHGHLFYPFFDGRGPIEDVYDWSLTSRGGLQYKLFDREEPECKKWGMCGV